MYKLKIADAFITGAIGGIFLASVRAIFGLPQSQWLASRSGRFVLAVIVYVIAFAVIAGFLFLAHCLYQYTSQYLNKVADALITGAIGGLLLAIVRAMFGLPKLQARTDTVGANRG